jgi:hypothetical protein
MNKLVKDWRVLRHGTPGRRFYDFHHARMERRGEGWPLERVLTVTVAAMLIAGGAAIGWLPGPGGFIGIIGVALLGAESLRVSRLLDRVEVWIRDSWHFLRTRVLVRPSARDAPPRD